MKYNFVKLIIVAIVVLYFATSITYSMDDKMLVNDKPPLPISQHQEEMSMLNIFENIPYSDDSVGRRKLLDEKHIFVMQVALKPNQSVPEHEANSNVNLLIVKGNVIVNCNGKDIAVNEGGLLPILYKTIMSISNKTTDNATFLVIKTPNPSEMK